MHSDQPGPLKFLNDMLYISWMVADPVIPLNKSHPGFCGILSIPKPLMEIVIWDLALEPVRTKAFR